MRIVKHTIGGFCLLAALGLAVVWMRSYWVMDQIYGAWYADDGQSLVYRAEYWSVGRGRLWRLREEGATQLHYDNVRDPEKIKEQIRAMAKLANPEQPLSYRQLPPPEPSRRSARPWHGFERTTLAGQRFTAIPIWLPLLILAIPAGLWLRGLLRRRPPHECPGCGYDLRASPDRCPECGRMLASAGTAAVQPERARGELTYRQH